MAIIASPIGTARMPTQGSWRPLVEISVSWPCASTVRRGRQDRRGRLDREARDDRLARRDAAENAAGIVGQELGRPVLAACASRRHSPRPTARPTRSRRRSRRPSTALMLISAGGDVLVELAVDRRAEARRHALGHDLDHGADRGALLAHLVEKVGPARGRLGIGAEERVAVRPRPNPSCGGRSRRARSG